MVKSVTFVLGKLENLFWCLSPGFWAWEIHWDHFQTPQIVLSGQIDIDGHLLPLQMRYDGQTSNFISEHARALILLSILGFWGM